MNTLLIIGAYCLFRLALLWFHTIVRPFFGLDGSNVRSGADAAQRLIDASKGDFSDAALFLFFQGRVDRLKVCMYFNFIHNFFECSAHWFKIIWHAYFKDPFLGYGQTVNMGIRLEPNMWSRRSAIERCRSSATAQLCLNSKSLIYHLIKVKAVVEEWHRSIADRRIHMFFKIYLDSLRM